VSAESSPTSLASERQSSKSTEREHFSPSLSE
jgi:hypothetical protein